MSGVEQLQAMFPDAAAEALEAVLSMLGGDVAAATNFLLGEEGGGILSENDPQRVIITHNL